MMDALDRLPLVVLSAMLEAEWVKGDMQRDGGKWAEIRIESVTVAHPYDTRLTRRVEGQVIACQALPTPFHSAEALLDDMIDEFKKMVRNTIRNKL